MPLRSEVESQKHPNKPNQAQATPEDRLLQSQKAAQQAAEATKAALVGGHQQQLVALSEALDRAEKRRAEVLERLSDRVAYLQDGDLFMHDLLCLAQSKLGRSQQPGQAVQVSAIDALASAFDAVSDWQPPAIAPSSAMGCLPM